MKILKALSILFLLIGFSQLTNQGESLKNNRKLEAAKITDSNGIADNGVYFIRNVGNNQLIDIPNSNYNTGTFPITYTANYNGNQRFIFSKQFDDTYRIKCLFSQDYLFRVEDDTYLENKRLVLSTEQYTTTKILSDKFSLQRYGKTNKFFIKTESSYGDKGLCVQTKDSSTGSQIVQATIPSMPNYINYYLWEFIKTDSINIHCPELDSMPTGGVKSFNLRVPYSVPYVISNDGTASYMELYREGTKIHTTGVAVRSFEYDLIKDTDYQLRVINTSSSQQITTKLEPKTPAFMYGMFDYGNQNYDAATPMLNSRSYYENAGMYPIVYNNLGIERVTMPNDGGWTPIKSKYVTIFTHGTAGAIHLYDGLSDENDTIIATDLPNDLSNVEMFILLSCYGANNLSGTTTSMIEEAVRRGAKYSLGFKNVLGGIPATVFYGYLSSNMVYKSGLDWVVSSHIDMMQHHQLEYQNNTIFSPYFYFRGSDNNSIYYTIANEMNNNIYDADTDLIYIQGSTGFKSINNTIQENKISDSDNKITINYFGKDIDLLITNDYYTNIIYDVNNVKIYLDEIDQVLKTVDRSSETTYLFVIKSINGYDIIEVNDKADNINEAYFSHKENRYISYSEYISVKNNFVN